MSSPLPGTQYILGAPTLVGTIPPRENLMPEPTSTPAPSFMVEAYSGAEVYPIIEGVCIQEPIRTCEGLRDQMIVACPSLVGYFRAVVHMNPDGTAYAQGDVYVGSLAFNQDSRHCWTSASTVNTRSIRR